ncbi:hypothetical protein VTO42DRAFT_5156 [Malbranchea cinnamomea]
MAIEPRQGAAVITSCSRPGVMALTFDDGPYQYQGALLDQLAAAGAKATFFVTGTLYNCIYSGAATLQRAYNEGHQIASHTWTHANLQDLDDNGIRTEMARVEDALANILGVKPRYMRPPYGATGGNVMNVLSQMGYKVVTWDVDSGDWNNTPVWQSQQVIQNAGTSGNGHIILMHEPIQSTVYELVPWLLDYARQNGLELVTVAECLGDAGGAYTPAQGNGGSTC